MPSACSGTVAVYLAASGSISEPRVMVITKRVSKKAAKTKSVTVAAPAKKRIKKIIGWREWVHLPDLAATRIKAKIDTGARTSALHAFDITPFTKNGVAYVRFVIHPVQGRHKPEVVGIAAVVDYRGVKDSGGRIEQRYVIRTTLKINTARWPIELTLTNRDQMGFRMLVGREALRGRYLVDASRSFVAKLKRKATSITALDNGATE